jgi:hypothetical protein
METNQNTSFEIIKHKDHYTCGGVVLSKHKFDGIETIGYAYQMVTVSKTGDRVVIWHATRLNRAARLIASDLKNGATIRNGRVWTAKALATLAK